MGMQLEPYLTLGAIYGSGLLYSPRASPHARTWLNPNPAVLDMFTGGQLTVLGELPVLCCAAVSSPEVLRLLTDAGFHVPEEPHRYRDTADHARLLSELSSGERRVVVQHVHPAADLAPEKCWVPPATLSFVNNKANLPALVDAPHVPRRQIVARERLTAELKRHGPPVVVKAVSDESGAGGFDMLICSDHESLGRASAYFEACANVVMEEFLEIQRNLCLSYAVDSTGRATYIGSAEQVTEATGRYLGNWLDAESEAPTEAVDLGFRVARAGFDHGFWGCLGIDMAILKDGRVVAFDLNFRINGSTSALLLAASVRGRHPSRPVLRLRSWVCRGTSRAALDAVYTALGRNVLLPLNFYDPAAVGRPDDPARVTGLILAESRADVAQLERELAALGIGI